jgi:hypothetical protein
MKGKIECVGHSQPEGKSGESAVVNGGCAIRGSQFSDKEK